MERTDGRDQVYKGDSFTEKKNQDQLMPKWKN